MLDAVSKPEMVKWHGTHKIHWGVRHANIMSDKSPSIVLTPLVYKATFVKGMGRLHLVDKGCFAQICISVR